MAERSNAAVLKTVEVQASGGSNPSLSASKILYWIKRCKINDLQRFLFGTSQIVDSIFFVLWTFYWSVSKFKKILEINRLMSGKQRMMGKGLYKHILLICDDGIDCKNHSQGNFCKCNPCLFPLFQHLILLLLIVWWSFFAALLILFLSWLLPKSYLSERQ